ncbi:MFS-type transporter SLC18B1-like [Asterias amurensis]|uniref:MFS-type transporter SLC18B1-like n=1 Tax=Asterias amurensis TaxID=7602 RepID=UPI003AB11CC2
MDRTANGVGAVNNIQVIEKDSWIHDTEVTFSQSDDVNSKAPPSSSANQRTAIGSTNHLEETAVNHSVEDKATPSKMTWNQKVTFLSATLAALADNTSFSIMAPFFPLEAEHRGLSSSTVGFIFSVFSLLAFLFSPLFGKILPLVRARFMFLAGSFLAGGCNILYGLLDEMPTKETFVAFAFILRAFEGIGAAASLTASTAIVAHAFPDNVGTATSIIEMMSGIGFMIGPALGGLLYSAGGFKLPFLLLGGIDLAIVAVNYFIMPEHGTRHDKPGSMRQVLSIPDIWVVMLAVLVGSVSLGFMDPTLSPHLKKLGLTVDQIGLVFLSYGATYGISAVLWGYIADKKKCTRLMIVIGSYGGAVSFLMIGPSPYLKIPEAYHTVVVLSACPLGAVSMAMVIMPTFIDMLNSAEWYGIPNNFALNGIISGLWGSLFSLGSMVGPVFGGYLSGGFGFEKAATVLAGFTIFGMLAMCFFGVWEYRCGKGKRIPSSRATLLAINSTDEEHAPLLGSQEPNGSK